MLISSVSGENLFTPVLLFLITAASSCEGWKPITNLGSYKHFPKPILRIFKKTLIFLSPRRGLWDVGMHSLWICMCAFICVCLSVCLCTCHWECSCIFLCVCVCVCALLSFLIEPQWELWQPIYRSIPQGWAGALWKIYPTLSWV